MAGNRCKTKFVDDPIDLCEIKIWWTTQHHHPLYRIVSIIEGVTHVPAHPLDPYTKGRNSPESNGSCFLLKVGQRQCPTITGLLFNNLDPIQAFPT